MDEFEKVYREVFPRIHGYIRLRVESHAAAADVTQVVMIDAWKNWKKFDPSKGKPYEAWFLGIARHRVADHWRRRKCIFPLDDEILENNFSFQEKTGQKQDAKELLGTLLANLTEEERRLLSLRYIDELTHLEIAKLHGKNPASIRKYFSRLEARLNQKFGNEWILLNS